MIITKMNALRPPFPELRGSLAGIQYPAIAELKLDGEFSWIFYDYEKAFTMNKYGNCRQEFKSLERIIDVLSAKGIRKATFLAELYYGDGKKGALYDLNSNKTSPDLKLFPFDALNIDGEPLSTLPLIDRLERMYTTLEILPSFEVVENEAEAMAFFKDATSRGYEGIVVKSLNGKFNNGPCAWTKIKYKDRSDYFVLSIDPVKERIEIGAPHGQVGHIVVGVKAPDRYKKHIKVGDKVTIEHQGVLPSGSLRHPVLIKKKGW
jgi:hypothetical protein